MVTIARGNEIVSSVIGISLFGRLAWCFPNFSEIDRRCLAGTSRGHVSHGMAVVCAVCLAPAGKTTTPQETFRLRIDRLGTRHIRI